MELEFTDKAQATLQAAIRLAKDYAVSQGMSIVLSFTLTPVAHYFVYAVYPAHIAFVLLNEGAGDEPAPGGIQIPLFASVIQKAGGDVVSTPHPFTRPCSPTHQMPDPRKTRIAAHHYSPSCAISTTR
jgi:hypothetical protein